MRDVFAAFRVETPSWLVSLKYLPFRESRERNRMRAILLRPPALKRLCEACATVRVLPLSTTKSSNSFCQPRPPLRHEGSLRSAAPLAGFAAPLLAPLSPELGRSESIADAIAGIDRAPARRADAPRAVGPGTAAQDALRSTLRWPKRVPLGGAIVDAYSVRAPLEDIAQHVVEAPWVALLQTHSARSGLRVRVLLLNPF